MPAVGTGPELDWLTNSTYCISPPAGDITGDCLVDIADFAVMAADWLECGYANQAMCP